MLALDLNLASRPFKNDTLLWAAFIVVAILVVFASWWNVETYFEHRSLLAGLEVSKENLQRRTQELDRRSGDAIRSIGKFNLAAIAVKAEKANEVIRWKAFSWTRLFNLLQSVQPYDVQMTSIHPVFRTNVRELRGASEDVEQVPVAVEGIAKSLEDFLAFERELIFSEHFDRVEPDRHTRDELTNEIVFRLRFLYDPRVPIESEEQLLAEDTGEDEPSDGVEIAEAGTGEVGLELPAVDAQTEDPLVSQPLQKIDRGGGRGEEAADVPASTDNADAGSNGDPEPQEASRRVERLGGDDEQVDGEER